MERTSKSGIFGILPFRDLDLNKTYSLCGYEKLSNDLDDIDLLIKRKIKKNEWEAEKLENSEYTGKTNPDLIIYKGKK